MTSKTVKAEKHPKKVEQKGSELKYVYADDKVKNYSFSDYVRIRSGVRGILFSFGKQHPESDNVMIYSEVLLPLDVAYNLQQIIAGQFEVLKEKKIIEEKENGSNGKEKVI